MNNYYPEWVYSVREDITRLNMKAYDDKRDAAYNEIKAKEKELARSLTLRERVEIYEKHGL